MPRHSKLTSLFCSPGPCSSFKFQLKCHFQWFPGQADNITTFSTPLPAHPYSRWRDNSFALLLADVLVKSILLTIRWRKGRKSMFLRCLFDFRYYIMYILYILSIKLAKIIEVNVIFFFEIWRCEDEEVIDSIYAKSCSLNSRPVNKSYYCLPVITHCCNITYKSNYKDSRGKPPPFHVPFSWCLYWARPCGLNSLFVVLYVDGSTLKQVITDDFP